MVTSETTVFGRDGGPSDGEYEAQIRDRLHGRPSLPRSPADMLGDVQFLVRRLDEAREVRRLDEAREVHRADWLPIETAPKDGSAILATGLVEPNDDWPTGRWIYVIRWSAAAEGHEGYWVEADGEGHAEFEPTDWSPLPVPPS